MASPADGAYQIYVKTMTGKTILLWVTASESVFSVKTKVAAETGWPEEDVPPEAQRLLYRGEQLVDDKSLSDYSVAKEATLHIRLRPYYGPPLPGIPADGAHQIYVKTMTGKTILLWVTASESVWSVKTGVAAETGLPPQAQRLIYRGRQLEDDKSLSDYSVAKEATLQMVYRPCFFMPAPAPAQEPQP